MIAERELEIEAFKSREYWTIEADVSKESQSFVSRLVRYKGDKVEQFSFENEKSAHWNRLWSPHFGHWNSSWGKLCPSS